MLEIGDRQMVASSSSPPPLIKNEGISFAVRLSSVSLGVEGWGGVQETLWLLPKESPSLGAYLAGCIYVEGDH